MYEILNAIFGNWQSWLYEDFIEAFFVAAWNFLVDVIQFFLSFSLGLIAGLGGPGSMTFQITGLSGWMAQQMNFAECIAVVLNAYLLKWLLRKIPFIKW